LAALCAGELTELATVDEIFCGLFWACELVNDVSRAEQWMRAAAERLQQSNVVAAFCRAHYGGILTAAGRWHEAETELIAAAGHFDRGMPERRAGAVIRLAGLRVRQGRLLERATSGSDTEVPEVGESTMVGPLLALLVEVHLEEGNVEDAERVAQRLGRLAEGQHGSYLRAVAALAKGQVRVASGGATPAPACMRRSRASRGRSCPWSSR
jgi:ATP/maltotriose-dependent transcriptional regulator MalT